MARGLESKLFNGVANAGFTASQAVFTLRGGKYAISAVGTSSGNTIGLGYLGPDSATFLPVGSATTFAADAVAVVDLAPGQYKFVVAGTITAGFAQVVRIPND